MNPCTLACLLALTIGTPEPTEPLGQAERSLRLHREGRTQDALSALRDADDDRSRLLRFRLHLLSDDLPGAVSEAESWLGLPSSRPARSPRADLLWTLTTVPGLEVLLVAEAQWATAGSLEPLLEAASAVPARHRTGADALLLDVAGRLAARGDLADADRILAEVEMIPHGQEWRLWTVRALAAAWAGDLRELDRVLAMLRASCASGAPLAEAYRHIARLHPTPDGRTRFSLAADRAGSGTCRGR